MPSHFSTIGFPMEGEEEFYELAMRATQDGETREVGMGSYIKLQEAHGAQVFVQVSKEQEITGMHPHYFGKSRMKVGLIHAVSRPDDSALDGAFYAWADPQDRDPESGDYPFVFDSPDFLTHQISFPAIARVQIAAFAHDIQVYADEQAYKELKPKFALASEAFIPTGLFTQEESDTPEPPQAYAIFAGSVLESARFTNSITGAQYIWALVRTYGGEVDVVVDPALIQEPIVQGNILTGSFWLSGQLV